MHFVFCIVKLFSLSLASGSILVKKKDRADIELNHIASDLHNNEWTFSNAGFYESNSSDQPSQEEYKNNKKYKCIDPIEDEENDADADRSVNDLIKDEWAERHSKYGRHY